MHPCDQHNPNVLTFWDMHPPSYEHPYGKLISRTGNLGSAKSEGWGAGICLFPLTGFGVWWARSALLEAIKGLYSTLYLVLDNPSLYNWPHFSPHSGQSLPHSVFAGPYELCPALLLPIPILHRCPFLLNRHRGIHGYSVA